MASESQVSFRLKTQTIPTESPGLHQPELLRGWSEFYPEELEPKPPVRSWWHKNRGDDV